MEYHIDCLKKLCRVCGEVITKHRVTYECTQKRELLLVGNIDISHDKETVHPGFFCNKCYSTLTHIKNEKVQTSGLKTVQWAEHNSDYRCETCDLYAQGSKGGRKCKARRGGNHSHLKHGQVVLHVSSLPLSPSYTSKLPLNQERFLQPPKPIRLNDFVCRVCDRVLNQPVETVCGHVMCKGCLCRVLNSSISPLPSCPVCSRAFKSIEDIKQPTQAITNILEGLQVHCDHPTCKAVVPLCALPHHVDTCVPHLSSQVLITQVPSTSVTSPQATSTSPELPVNQTPPLSTPSPCTPEKRSLADVLQAPLDQTPTPLEKEATTHLIKRLLKKQERSQQTSVTIELKTGGQVKSNKA